MTLVQNRLRLSSGNNLIILLLIFLGVTSCSAKKVSATKKVEVINIQPKITSIEPKFSNTSKSYEDSIYKNPVIFDLDNNYNKDYTTNSNTNTSTTKNKVFNNDPNRIHNIAVILPFFLDQIPLGQYVDDSTKQLSVDSRNAIEFYLGCQMARERFISENLQTNVYFLDDRNDSLTTVSLFNVKPFPNVDYIVGPLYFKTLKTVADLARNNQIPLISPIANSMYIKDNFYYFNAIGSLKSQYEFILQQTKTKFPAKNLEVIYDGQDSTAESINILKSLADKYYGYATIKYSSLRAWDDAAKSLSLADTLSERVVLIYSSKETYIKSIIAKLKPTKNHLHIFATSCIKSTKALEDSKNPHSVYAVYPFNTDNPNFSFFAAKYEEKYKKKTTETANQAFDIMMHLLNSMDKNKNLQDNTYNYTSDFDNTQTKFQFKPVLNKNGNVDYYDNTFLYLYKYVNGTFIITTP